ncbi:hypothetical protein P691DRAFT_760636 [Macrolepiota fuliginosa MF-IS2]|uniref:Hydrophobin n=1 Tax=Macrolepiota fuliginosa MF-IS2 TaxID=1400762 RepID=A0A9P5XD00_9AGAR|nr:hypothetical protein P691DRAFT_760636 [Macrolepiota fuliginosa MF-IS2]
MYCTKLIALVSLVATVRSAPQYLCPPDDKCVCCSSLKDPTYFSAVEHKGKNAGQVGYNCTTFNFETKYDLDKCSGQPACCSGNTKVDDSVKYIYGCSPLRY